jgi:hypothetical protein
MWQRIQTLFLVIVIISLIASIFLPIWGYQEGSGKIHQLYPLHYTVIENNVRTTQYYPYCITAVLTVAAATLAFISVRKFKDRVLQMKLGALNSLVLAGTILSAVLFANQFLKIHHAGSYGLGLWIPGAAVICNLIANRFIRRDERLVRDSERLR